MGKTRPAYPPEFRRQMIASPFRRKACAKYLSSIVGQEGLSARVATRAVSIPGKPRGRYLARLTWSGSRPAALCSSDDRAQVLNPIFGEGGDAILPYAQRRPSSGNPSVRI